MSNKKTNAIFHDEKVITTVYIRKVVKVQADRYAASRVMKRGELQEKSLLEYMQNHP